MTQFCKITNRSFTVTEFELRFLEQVATANKFLAEPLPIPTVYPTEILRQMAPFGNQLYLHKLKSALSGAATLSRFDALGNYRIVTSEEFWNDETDNTEFGMEYDFSRPFFEQWNELMHRSYLLPLLNDNIENCEFANGCFNCKSCYLCFDTTESQDCMYCFNSYKGQSNLDCIHTESCSYCYACSDVAHCYECQHCTDCSHSANCFGCLDCRSCNDCIGCVGLSNANYQIFNKQYTKEAYTAFLAANDLSRLGKRRELLEQAQQLHKNHTHISHRMLNCEDCSGSYLRNSSNLQLCYNAIASKDCAFLLGGINARDFCKGFSFNSELGYCAVSSSCYNCNFAYCTSNCNNCWYSFYLFNNCSECFGCVGLKKKSYCILNKQYSKEAYEEMLPRIVNHMKSTGEWCQWFPVRYGTNSYEECWADSFLVEISMDEAKKRGYKSVPLEKVLADVNALTITEDTKLDVKVLAGKPIRCSLTGQPFSFQKAELDFYEKFGIPIPITHWRERLKSQLSIRDRMPDLIN